MVEFLPVDSVPKAVHGSVDREKEPSDSRFHDACVDGHVRMVALVYGIVLIVGIGLAVRLGLCGLPCPTSDDAWYRSPAAELVQNGRMAIPSTGSLLPRTQVTFACYPPLYQLLLSGWYWLFGFSQRTSLAFSYAVPLLRRMGVMVATRRAVAVDSDLTALARGATIAAVGLMQVANLANFDRPEETALLWIWMDVLWVQGMGLRHALASGVLLGLAGLTSPWVGVLGAMLVTVRMLLPMVGQGEAGSHPFSPPQTTRGRPSPTGPRRHGTLRDRPDWPAIKHTALVAATLVGSWVVVSETKYPGIIHDQFFGVMRHIAQARDRPRSRRTCGSSPTRSCSIGRNCFPWS